MKREFQNRSFDKMISFIIILFVLIVFSAVHIIGQEVETENENRNKIKSTEKINAPAALNDKIEFKNGTPAAIITITDEGNDAGSILLPSVGSGLGSVPKLYNNGGNLFWGGSQLNGGSGATAINDLTDAKYDGSSLFVGEGAGNYDDGTNYNTAIGRNALFSNTSGGSNNANGHSALFSNTTGYYNTANGSGALYSNTTGNSNTANGWEALASNTTGYYNTANGFSSLSSNTTGNSNTANGMFALSSNTTGSQNTANGYQALYSNTTGINNTASGFYALRSNTTGTDNTASGGDALYSNTTGHYNTASGNFALYSNTTGSRNVGIGNQANYYNQSGYNNTIIGYQAGMGSVAHNKSSNIFIGYQAGYNESTDNKLYIENSSSSSPLIWGDFANDDVKINGDFHVTGSITTDGAAPADNDWDINGNELLLFNPVDQYVGIGTLITETSAKLHVKGNNGVLFQGTHGSGTALDLGAGTRFQFYSKKSAIRGGNVNGTQWNDANIGDYSTAFGQNTIASGFIASALGSATIASGSYSAALGVGTKAEAFYSTAIGAFNIGGGSPTTIVATNPVFEVGIGTSDGTRANALTVLKNGKVGIGTNATTYRVEIKAETGENPLKVKVNTSGKLTVFSNGGTSIGTDATAPTNGLLVSGDINNTGGLLHASDLRFKTNIEEIPNTLEHIKKLRGVYYNWKRDEFPERNFNDKKQIGVIAQEVEKEFPELVNTGEDGYKSVDYTKLTPILIEAIKEQQKIIEELQNQNSEARTHNSELENRLSKIESLLDKKSFTNASN